MDRLRTLVAAVLLACGTAHAGYAQLAPPPGFSGSGGSFGYAAAANDAAYGRVIHQAGGLSANVGGQAVKMPAAYRLAANAPRIAARAVFLNPYVAVGVGVAAWLLANKVNWNSDENKWQHWVDVEKVGLRYRVYVNSSYGYTAWLSSMDAACAAAGAHMNSNDGGFRYSLISVQDYAPSGFNCRFSESWNGAHSGTLDKGGEQRETPYIEPEIRPITTPEQMERILNPDNQVGWPMPSTVPMELPSGTPLPVDQPFINPAPGPSPANRPLFVPTGNPLPNPNYNPNVQPGPNNQPYYQPGVRVVPAPTPNSPWQVDLQPVDRPVDSPNPNPDPVPDPVESDGDTPKEEQPDLCEKNPEIVACQKLGDVQPEALAKNTVTMSITKQDGFGPESGQCPAPKEFVVMGKSMAFRWDLLCDFATGIRPLLIGFAWLSAALAFIGLSRKDS